MSWCISRRRKKLARRARQYESLVVMGCEAAVETVRDAVKSTGQRVIQGLKTVGIMNVTPRYRAPGSVSLDLQGITPTVFPEQGASPRRRRAKVCGRSLTPAERRAAARPAVGAQASRLRSQRSTFSASR